MKLRHVLALLIAAWLGVVGLKIADALHHYAREAHAVAVATTALANVQEVKTKLLRRYMHALDDAEGER